MVVTKASLMLEIDGQICHALLDGIDINLMVDAISSMMPDNTLKVLKMSEDYTWQNITRSDVKDEPIER
jgi:hypothetical protein